MNNSESPQATFKRLAESFTDLLEGEGIFLRPYANPNLIHFCRLNPAEQQDVLARVKMYVLGLIKVKENHGALSDNRLAVETFLHVTGLHARQEDLMLMNDDHLIEIYNKNGMHLFRSLNIFEMSSYTFEDLCCRQWHHLYERHAEAQEKIVRLATEFFMQKKPSLMLADHGPMKITEKDTLENLIYIVETKYLVPIFRGDSLEAVLTIVINWNPDTIPQHVKP